MASAYSSNSSSEHSNVMWDHGDDYIDFAPNSPTVIPVSFQPVTADLTSPLTTMNLSPQPKTFSPDSSINAVHIKKIGRPKKYSKFHGNRYTTKTKTKPASSQDTPIEKSAPRRSNQPVFTFPMIGYSSQFSKPRPFLRRKVEFKTSERTTSKPACVPSGMRLLDVGILAQAITKLKCSKCSSYLSLYETEFTHGWQTIYSIKCSGCHVLFAEFPSSKPTDLPTQSNFVNVHHSISVMNEVTMRSVLAVHCSGFYWQDLHKFATIFDMPLPLARMPSRYMNKIESIVQIACQTSMKAAGEELHLKVDAVPSPVSNCVNIAVSFDSSWKTRGFYSNLGFGSVISATSKKVLDYVLLNRICEKCNQWNEKRKQDNPEAYKLWYDSHKPNCFKNFNGSSQSMEPEAAKIIWSRSIEKHQLCYSTFIGDGDSKSYPQVVSMDPYPLVPIHKEECLVHVQKALCRFKKNTKTKIYIQHKIPLTKAEYISSNFSTVVIQHRGKSPAQMAAELNILLAHASGDHTCCPVDSWCRWRQSATTSKPPPTATTNFTTLDIQKVREVFNNFATVEFCKHLTLGMTQNANESLHNSIWNYCPKAKYLSPQSVRISTGIAIIVFNEGEPSMYGLLCDLKLNPSYSSFWSLCRRQLTRQQHCVSSSKRNLDRATRRQKPRESAGR